MSIKSINDNRISEKTLYNNNLYDVDVSEPWFRNPSWLPLPDVSVGDQRIVSLFAVWDHGANHVAFQNQGATTVDWGDGVIENYTSNEIASHLYSFDDVGIPSSTMAPVTFDSITNTVNRNSHGYSNGQWVKFHNIDSSIGLNNGEKFYIVNRTDNTFQLTKEYKGDGLESIINFSNSGSATILRYKQVIISIIPQEGHNLTNVNFNIKHPSIIPNIYPNVSYLDILVSLPNATVITLQSNANIVIYSDLEQFQSISQNLKTDYSYFFQYCMSLRSVPVLAMPSGTNPINATSMFFACKSLTEAPLFDTSNITNMTNIFYYCTSLVYIPEYNTSKVTNMSQAFYMCNSLKYFPLIDTSNVTNINQIFFNCYSLLEVHSLDVSKVTIANNIFYNCSSLVRVSNLNFASYTGAITNMFYNCTALQEVKGLYTPLAKGLQGLFYNCQSLKEITDLDCGKNETLYQCFFQCFSLVDAPYIDMSSCTNTYQMFYNCINLKSIPNYDMSNVASAHQMFRFCYSLQYLPELNLSSAITLNNTFDGCSSLIHIEGIITSNLLTNTPYMFYNCNSLQTVPLFDTSGVTNMTYMFYNCFSLKKLPKFNTSNVKNFSGFLLLCYSLNDIPDLDFSNANNLSACFQGTNTRDLPYMNLYNASLLTNMAYSNTNIDELDLIAYNAKNVTNLWVINSNINTNIKRIYGYGQKMITNLSFAQNRLQDFIFTNIKYTLSLAYSQLTKEKLELAMRNLDNVYTANTLTLSYALGNDTTTTRACDTTINSNVITCTNTTGLLEDMTVFGIGLPQTVDQTGNSNSLTNRITLNNHGIQNGCPINIRNWHPTVTAGALPSLSTWSSISYGNGVYLAIGNVPPGTIGTIARSTDGINWANVNLPETRPWSSIFYGNGKFIVTCQGTANVIAVSIDDGLTWNEIAMPVGGGYWANGKYDNGKYVIVAGGDQAVRTTIAHSTDAITWEYSIIASSGWSNITYGNNRWIAVSNQYCYISYDNAETWIASINATSLVKRNLIYSNDMFILFVNTGTTYYTSPDGGLWTVRALPSGSWSDCGFSPEGRMILSNTELLSTTVYMSDDGCTWQLLDVGQSSIWGVCVYSGNNEFVILQSSNTSPRAGCAKLTVSPEGFRPNKTYYAVNVDTDTFQLSETVTGLPITLGTDSNVVFRTGAKIISITPNTDITISSNCISTGTATLSFKNLDINPALCKGWTVTS